MKQVKRQLINTIWFCLCVVLSFVICFYLLDDLLLKFYPIASRLLYLLMRLCIAIMFFVISIRLFKKEKMLDNSVLNLSILIYLVLLIVILFLGRSPISTGINLIP